MASLEPIVRKTGGRRRSKSPARKKRVSSNEESSQHFEKEIEHDILSDLPKHLYGLDHDCSKGNDCYMSLKAKPRKCADSNAKAGNGKLLRWSVCSPKLWIFTLVLCFCIILFEGSLIYLGISRHEILYRAKGGYSTSPPIHSDDEVARLRFLKKSLDLQLQSLKEEITTVVLNCKIEAAKAATIELKRQRQDIGNLSKDQPNYVVQNDVVTSEEVSAMITAALDLYDADKLGIPDFALESSGGSIHHPHFSPTYDNGSPILKGFGMTLWRDTRQAHTIIQPETHPGSCWPMKGQKGFVVIRLSAPVIPKMFTLEHLHKSLSTLQSSSSLSTPRNVTVLAWMDEAGVLRRELSTYVYKDGGPARQTFQSKVILKQAIQLVELRILSNYGNPDFTCIYRFRVHA